MKNSGNQNNKKKRNGQQDSPGSTENQITIPIKYPGTFHITLLDLSDRAVYATTIEVQGQEFILNLSDINLAPGQYLAELISDKESHLIKIFKK